MISCREEGVPSDVGACHAPVCDLTSGLQHALGYRQNFFVDFQPTKTRCVENYFDEIFTDKNFQIYGNHYLSLSLSLEQLSTTSISIHDPIET